MAKQQPSFLILQFDPLKQSTTKLSCNLTYTPKNMPRGIGFPSTWRVKILL